MCIGRAMTRLTAVGFLGRPCYRTCPRWWLLMMPIPLFWCRAAPHLSVLYAFRLRAYAVRAVARRRCMFFGACRGVFCGWCSACLCSACLCSGAPRALSGFCLIRGAHLLGFYMRSPAALFCNFGCAVLLVLFAFSCCTLLKLWVRSVGFARLHAGLLSAGCKSVIV